MSTSLESNQHWEIRPTLRLTAFRAPNFPDRTLLDGVADALRQHSNIAFANVGAVLGTDRVAVTATITFTHPSTLGVAVEEATRLLMQASVASGLTIDTIVEVVAEPGGIDPRSLL